MKDLVNELVDESVELNVLIYNYKTMSSLEDALQADKNIEEFQYEEIKPYILLCVEKGVYDHWKNICYPYTNCYQVENENFEPTQLQFKKITDYKIIKIKNPFM